MMRNDLGKLVLRTGLSALMISHGWSKLLRLMDSGSDVGFANPFGFGSFITILLAIFAELICPLMIILGWKTRWFTIPLIITMATAAFIIHIDDPWKKMELPLLYLVGFIAVAFMGAGKWSFDGK